MDSLGRVPRKNKVVFNFEVNHYQNWDGSMAFRFQLPKEWYGHNLRLIVERRGKCIELAGQNPAPKKEG